MLHHVSLEIPPTEVEACIGFWAILGFEHVQEPEELNGYVTWVQRDRNQIHLIHTEAATVPVLGHAAIAVDDFAATMKELRAAGHRVEPAQDLWGERRAFAIMPGGHRVEVMAAPPT